MGIMLGLHVMCLHGVMLLMARSRVLCHPGNPLGITLEIRRMRPQIMYPAVMRPMLQVMVMPNVAMKACGNALGIILEILCVLGVIRRIGMRLVRMVWMRRGDQLGILLGILSCRFPGPRRSEVRHQGLLVPTLGLIQVLILVMWRRGNPLGIKLEIICARPGMLCSAANVRESMMIMLFHA